MSSTIAGIVFLASLILAPIAVHAPLGDYRFRVYNSDKHSRVERVLYRAIGADPSSQQGWGACAPQRPRVLGGQHPGAPARASAPCCRLSVHETPRAPRQVRGAIAAHTDGCALGFMGEPGVNVLAVNIALDEHPPGWMMGR